MKAVINKIYQYSKWTLLVFLFCIAILSLTGRTLLSNVSYFKLAIEQQLTDYGIKGVDLNNIEGHWQGIQPYLKIKGASLSIPGRSHSLSVNELSLRVKLIPSLLSGDLKLESFYANIEKLVLVRDVKGGWWLNDIPLTAGGIGNSKLGIFEFFQRLPSFVNIDIGLIQLRDLRHQDDYFIQGSKLRSSRKLEDLSLEFFSRLPSSLGSNIQFFLKGDAVNQQLYVKADGLDLPSLFQLTSVEKIPLYQAIISLQSWADLNYFSPTQVITKARVEELAFNKVEDSTQTLNFSFLQKAKVENDLWRVDTKFEKLRQKEQILADINTQMLISKKGDLPQLWVDNINLSFLNSILRNLISDQSVLKLLAKVNPVATVRNVVAELDVINPVQSIIGFDFSGFNSDRFGSIPAINGLSGSLVSSQGQSQITIDAKQLSLDFGSLFRSPIRLDALKANSFVYIKDSKILIENESFSAINRDAQIQGRMNIQSEQGEDPFIYIRAKAENAKVKSMPKYLPVEIMPETVVNWLDKSFISGDIKHAEILYHGRFETPSIFVKKNSGVVFARVNVKNAETDYLADWPIARQANGWLEFNNTAIDAGFKNIKFSSTNIDQLNLSIPNLLSANLFIKANSRNRTKNLLSALSSLPILNVFDDVEAKAVKLGGHVNSELNINIPLSENIKKTTKITAIADLKDVEIDIPEWMINLKKLNGIIDIEDEKIHTDKITGLFYGDEIQLSAVPDKSRKRTNLHVSGSIESRNLLELAPDYLKQPVLGHSPWGVSISVAHQPTDENALLEISAASNLAGTQLDFPQPFYLSKSLQRPLSYKAKLFEKGDYQFDLSLGNNFHVAAAMTFSAGDVEDLHWLNIAIGQDNDIKNRHGISVKGNCLRLDMNEWFRFKKQYFSDEDENSDPFLKQLNSFEMDIERLILGNQKALNSSVKLVNNGSNLEGSITSNLTKGSFQLPYRMGVIDPFVADLEYLRLKKPQSTDETDIDINDMPNLYLKSNQLSFEKMDFSNLILSTRTESNKFVVEQLSFSRDAVNLLSSGSWQFEPISNEHVSVFHIDINGSDFGQTVENLGLGESIRGSTVDFSGQIGWGGELYNINWPSLIGEVDLHLHDGYLRNVDPGAGRFVGLLSFNALPKRLFLNFGDVVREGMQFDDIKGRFKIKGEIMETEDASLDSVSARIKVAGKTNLRHQTYDQTMIIIPKIGETLPLIGTIAAGSTVGWGLLLLQQIFNKPIEKSVEIEYKVTGSWDNPEVNLLENPEVK